MLHVLPADCADCSNKIFVTNCYGWEPLPYGIKDYRIIRHKWTNILKIKVLQEWRSLESSSYGNEIWDKIWDEIMSFGHWSLAIGYCILVIGHRISPFWVEKLESLNIWKVWNVWTDLEFLKVWTVLNVWGSGQSAHGLLIKHIRIVILPICKTCVWNFLALHDPGGGGKYCPPPIFRALLLQDGASYSSHLALHLVTPMPPTT